MGNLSNPSINRWGSNLFWYKMWYKDKTTTTTINLDYLIIKFVRLYVLYGVYNKYFFFINKIWLSSDFKFIKKKIEDLFNKTQRNVSFKNMQAEDDEIVKAHDKLKNIFFAKIWLFRYQNWLIINFYAFTPFIKKRNKRRNRKFIKNYDINFLTKTTKSLKNLNRKFKLFIYIFKSFYSNPNYFIF